MVLEPEGLLRQLSPSLLDRRTALQAAAKGEHLQFLKTVGGEPCWETGCGRKMVSLGEKVLESQLPVGSPRNLGQSLPSRSLGLIPGWCEDGCARGHLWCLLKAGKGWCLEKQGTRRHCPL